MMSKKSKFRKNNLFRIKIEHENIPIVDEKSNSLDSVNKLFESFKSKFGGKK